MRLDWLKDIVSIAETGSFSEAAQRRNLTQSAFSRRIRQIEDDLGIELFDRSKKPVQLRPTTAEHLDRMARMIGAMHELADDLCAAATAWPETGWPSPASTHCQHR